MASIDDLADVECGSEEVPFTAAKFVKGRDVPLPEMDVKNTSTYIVDIIKLTDGSILIACSHGLVYTLDSTGQVDKKWKLGMCIYCVTEVSNGCYIAACRHTELYQFKNGSNQVAAIPGAYDGKTVNMNQMRLMDNYLAVNQRDGMQLLIKTFRGDAKKALVNFGIPQSHIRIVKENDTPFIYACGNGSAQTDQVTKLSMTGEILKVYNNWEFSDARSIATTGDGHVFVCFPKENSIHLITPQMDREVTVLDSSNGLQYPTAIYYYSDKRKLYVANSHKYRSAVTNIMTFDVKY